MARCERGYLCAVCGAEVEAITDSALYLAFVLGEVLPEQLHLLPESHLRCTPTVAQYIADPRFPAVRCEGPFSRELLDPQWVKDEETRVTRGWQRLQEVAELGIPLLDYPLPEVKARWQAVSEAPDQTA